LTQDHQNIVSRESDVYVVFKPNWLINDFDGLVVASTHGSPWRYDSFVPVVFAGSDIRQQQIHRRISTVDVARTLAAYLGIRPPSGSTGTILFEVLMTH
jgi:phosphopentomutase